MSSQTFFYDVNGDYIKRNVKTIETFIEPFGLDIANNTNVNNSKDIAQLKEVNESIDRSTLVKGFSKLMSDIVTEVTSENVSELAKAISLSNKMNLSKIRGKNVTLTNITQSIKVDSEVSAEFTNKVQTKIINDITRKVSEKISKIVDDSKKSFEENVETSATGTNIGNVVSDVAGTIGDTIKDVLSLSIGNSTDMDNSLKMKEEVKKNLKLDESFKFEKNRENSDLIKNRLDSKNLSKCAQTTNQSNELNFSDAELEGDLVVKDIKQVAAVNAVMKCAFRNEILNEISNKILDDYEQNINNMIKSADEYAKKNNTNSTAGDIYAAGVAGGKILEGTGKAAQGIGAGVSDAARGVGEGVSTGAQGVGKGIGSVLGGMVGPLIIGGIILVVLIIGYVIFKKMGGIQRSDVGVFDDE